MRDRLPVVYILASARLGTLYIGVTTDLPRRLHDHRTSPVPSFTQRHRVDKLVYFEVHDSIADAIVRETNLKRWRRLWKIALIESFNPYWRDLTREVIR